jgi:hypothetical protein
MDGSSAKRIPLPPSIKTAYEKHLENGHRDFEIGVMKAFTDAYPAAYQTFY